MAEGDQKRCAKQNACLWHARRVGELDDQASVSGGILVMESHWIKAWSKSQAGAPATCEQRGIRRFGTHLACT